MKPESTPQPQNSAPESWVVWEEAEVEHRQDVLPRTALRMLAGISLGLDVVAAGIQGSALEREGRTYYHCVLQAQGIVASRFNVTPPKVPLSSCYPADFSVVIICIVTGGILLAFHIATVLLLLVALAIGQRRLSFPWVALSAMVTLQEVVLVATSWALLHEAELALFGCHAFLLAVGLAIVAPFLQPTVEWTPAPQS